MDGEDFFRALKGNAALLVKLDNLRAELQLDKLYLIYLNYFEAMWGVRSSSEINKARVAQKIQEFIKNETGDDYGGETRRMIILKNDLNEVAYMAKRALTEIHYQGTLEILYADDVKGEALLTVDPLYQKGLRNTLTHLLPWLKKVDFINEEGAVAQSAITVTGKAAKKIWEIMQRENSSATSGLRFRVAPGGCAGYQYSYNLESKSSPDDEVIEAAFQDKEEKRRVRVFIDQTSLQFLRGCILDYGPLPNRGFEEDFQVDNPNAKGDCDCGKLITF